MIETNSPKVLILCVGNILLRDEGFGPAVASELMDRFVLPLELSVLDRGVMGMAILADLQDVDEVLVIDAVDNSGQPPGSILQFNPADLAEYQVFHTAHDVHLADVLQAAALIGLTPKVTCLGVQVQEISPDEYQIGLTPAVAAAVPRMLELVEAWLAQRGMKATKLGERPQS
ncbi:MAG: hydrogenase maturation protease [Coriobacteriia bacterium]|nr:hydrogenase maturation protease [Coriobacteriia bacterium]